MLDGSALLHALIGKAPADDRLRARLTGMQGHAPYLIDAEVGNVLRRHHLQGLLTQQEALLALRAAPALIERRYPHTGPLAEFAWSLRRNVTFYDGLYVALATALGIPLLTADARLANAPGLTCQVELV